MPRSLSETDINLQRILCKLPAGSSGSPPPGMEMCVGSGWGAGGSLPGVGGDTLYPGPPSRRFLAVSVDTGQGLCPFSTPGLAPCLWGDVEGDRVEAGCSRPPGSPPASVLFGQRVFSLSGPGWHLVAFTKWPVLPVVMGAREWLWQQLDLGAHEPHMLVTPEGIGVEDGAPPPPAAAGLPD